MTVKRLLIISSFFMVLCIAVLFLTRPKASDSVMGKEDSSYLIEVPVYFSSANQPCIDLEVESQNLESMIDLGFQGAIRIDGSVLNKIKDKIFLRERTTWNVRGKEKKSKVFQIPRLKIGRLVFASPPVEELSANSRDDVFFSENGRSISSKESCLLGWELFEDTNLLLDFKNSRIIFCDSFQTLQKQGCFRGVFFKVPLLMNRGLLEVEAKTERGVIRCVLDTGSTWNILNSPLSEGESFETAIWDEGKVVKIEKFQLAKRDFGSIPFRSLPIQLPICVEAILGMEFLCDHLIFIDFANQEIYFPEDRRDSV